MVKDLGSLTCASRSLTEHFTFLNINLWNQHLWLYVYYEIKQARACSLAQGYVGWPSEHPSSLRQNYFLPQKMGLCPNCLLEMTIDGIPEWCPGTRMVLICMRSSWAQNIQRSLLTLQKIWTTTGQYSNPTDFLFRNKDIYLQPSVDFIFTWNEIFGK